MSGVVTRFQPSSVPALTVSLVFEEFATVSQPFEKSSDEEEALTVSVGASATGEISTVTVPALVAPLESVADTWKVA
ncbi:hypothetical protein SDC9_146785 [bioreactor metagenome]|uniref:Uncharacterized protein n=1 Tax=bioreactor metagenome TaxID=1076179 RepID=A0A645EFQ3_9ZZZZ